MDKATRNSIQRATQAGRTLLERAFSAQLEGIYDILLNGTIPEQPGRHLDDRQRVIREKLIAAVTHKCLTGLEAKEALKAYLREVAFTTLNRFVALKMLEARQLVQECVSRGEGSSGFTEFTALAPGLVAIEDKGYRLYIETVCDEIGQEVRVLFDRRDVASLLWPDRQTLLELFNILNAPELAGVWAEDETIGWVYQYFNGDRERAQMREESQAPRNSRELAVRNQFFTPRYVVQFLADNTLGLIWYEMMQGDTKLAHLDYLVRRPNEVFLADGESAPDPEVVNGELSQEDLLRQTVYVPFRAKKDPRSVRVLDPACGSGHFLLYAFELLVSIYEEAWGDAEAATFTGTGRQLRKDYGSVEELRHAMPQLILRHNLHGVDIDPRAAQIAALALWMRAQRASNQFDVSRAERPPTTKTNIVVAEPMPGDAEMADELATSLKPAVLGGLFKKMVEEMKLAGELGSLLRLEELLAKAVKEAEEAHSQGNLFAGEAESQAFWDAADEKIIAALGSFAESAEGSVGIRRKLFVGDATQGVDFIELMRKRFDVVLMNPPFGYATDAAISYVASTRVTDIDALFVTMGVRSLDTGGFLGAIVNRTQLFKPALQDFREEALLHLGRIDVCADLGSGVLDALVETSAFTVRRGPPMDQARPSGIFGNCLGQRDKRAGVLSTVSLEPAITRVLDTECFRKLPATRFAHWVHPDFLAMLGRSRSLIEDQHVAFGLSTTDNFRFVRLRWEVPSDTVVSFIPGEPVSGWVPLAKGGEYSPYIGDIHLVVDWRTNGAALRATPGAPIRNEALYGLSGLTYSKRTASAFSPRLLPPGCIPEVNGPVIVARQDDSISPKSLLALLVGRVASYTTDILVAAGDTSVAGSAAKDYIPGVIGQIPLPQNVPGETEAMIEDVVGRLAAIAAGDETAAQFELPPSLRYRGHGVRRFWQADQWKATTQLETLSLTHAIDQLVEGRGYALSDGARDELGKVVGPTPGGAGGLGLLDDLTLGEMVEQTTEALVNHALDRGHSRKDISKNSYRVERRLELLSALSGENAQSVADVIGRESDTTYQHYVREVSFAVGCVLGRWSMTKAYTRPQWGTGAWPDPLDVTFSSAPAACDDEPAASILADDSGNDSDIASQVRACHGLLAEGPLGPPQTFNLRSWLQKEFFALHIDQYSKSRRKAPIYWQLATPSASYSVWCYYHRLTRDTFFRVTNDYVTPKVDHEERKLDALGQEAGRDPSSKQRKAIDAQETFVAELRAFKTEATRIAPLWNPNLNDGVIVNFAPLWRLVPQHKPWQKECRKVWDKLVRGDYDWAHLAMHLWPERVVPKCQEDRSLAIAHGLEDEFWYEVEDGRWRKRQVNGDRVEQLVAERASTAVKAALQDLLEAPVSAGQTRRKKKVRS